MTTARDLCIMALKDSGAVGVGQTPLDEDINDTFTKLNWMLARWARKRWLVYHLETVSKTSTGAQSYTVGLGGDFSISRPDRIESAFMRQISNPGNLPDYPLEIIQARETYNLITLKSLVSFPAYLFYDSDFPLGKVYPWPVMQANNYALHLTVKNQLQSIANLSTTVVLPPEYEGTIEQNLALVIAPGYGVAPDPAIIALAKDGLNTIRGANTQIGELRVPRKLRGRGAYNIFSDTFR